MTNYELFWLNELPGGALGGNYGGNRVDLADLPINETLAGRIRALSAPGADVQLHLPYLTARDRKDWPARQLELPVTTDGWHRIVAGDEAEHQFSALLAPPWLAGSSRAPLLFHDEREWKASDWLTWVRPMLAAHRMGLPGDWSPTGAFRLRLTIELPAAHSLAWAEIPHRRDARFLDQFRGVSTSVQKALRAWLPFQYLAQTSRYTKTQFAQPYMVYGLLPPHPSRRKTQLTFHVLEPHRVVRSMTRLAKPMADQIQRALTRMEADGVDSGSEYLVDGASEVVRSMHKLPRTFASLLSLEAFVVEELVRFAGVAFETQAGKPTARALAGPGLELLHNLRCRLGRSYGGESYANLANLILVAATAGLIWRREPQAPLRAHTCLTDVETGGEIRTESAFSYANF